MNVWEKEESTRACQRLAIDVKVAPVDIARCCRRSAAAVERSARDETSAFSIHSKPFQILFVIVITQRVDKHLLKLLLQKKYFDNAT